MTRRAFTLAEMLIVIGLLLSMVSLSLMFSSAYFRNQYLASAGELVERQIRLAQTEAATQSDDAGHGIKVFPTYVVRFTGSTYASRTASLDEITNFDSVLTVPGSSEVDIPALSIGPVSSVTITLETNARAEDITVTPYGVLTHTSRTVSR